MIEIVDVQRPTPQGDEILVRVRAATVNRSDCAVLLARPFFMRAMTGLLRPKRDDLGSDFAGEVEAVGPAVTHFAVGDRVWGFNDMGLGSHGECLTIRETEVMRLDGGNPGNLSPHPSPENSSDFVARRAIARRSRRPGELFGPEPPETAAPALPEMRMERTGDDRGSGGQPP